MARQTINTGSVLGDRTGDNGRVAFTKVNENFAELYAGGYSPITAAEIAAGVTPTNYAYNESVPNRYTTNTTPGTTVMTTALQAAIDVYNAGGAPVELFDETYLSGQLTVPANGVVIRGRGYNSVVKLANSTNAIVFASDDEANPVNNVLLENFRVDGNVANQNQALFNRHIIGIRNLRNSTLRKLWLENANGDAISITEDSASGVPTNVVVDTVWCTGYIRNGISVTSGLNIKIINPVCYSPHASADPGDGIDVEINPPLTISGVTIINPTCYSNTGVGGRGVAIIGTGTDVEHVKVIGGEVYDNTIGLYAYYARFCSFVGTSSMSNDDDGVQIVGSCVGTKVIGVQSISNTGYGIREVTSTGTPNSSAIVGCHSAGNGTNAVTLLGSDSSKALNFDGSTSSILVPGSIQAGSSTPVLNHADGYVELTENGDPAAPAANKVRLYSRDTGGKTELVARFTTGAVQQVAIEP